MLSVCVVICTFDHNSITKSLKDPRWFASDGRLSRLAAVTKFEAAIPLALDDDIGGAPRPNYRCSDDGVLLVVGFTTGRGVAEEDAFAFATLLVGSATPAVGDGTAAGGTAAVISPFTASSSC